MPTTKRSVRTSATHPAISILKTASCPTLSGSSNLQYQLGKDNTGTLHFRISDSDGNGFFSQEWVAWPDIQSALAAEKPITSVVLRPLFTGKSVNTTGFLLAALHKERVVEPLKGKTKHFQLVDPAVFLDKVAKLQPPTPVKAAAAKSKEGAVTTPAKVSAKLARKAPATTPPKKPTKPKPTAARKA